MSMHYPEECLSLADFDSNAIDNKQDDDVVLESCCKGRFDKVLDTYSFIQMLL